ncbi:transposase [Frankia sp. B2]|uniref:RNA-guided endonuclease InsQ/TnpB family protein n=1 Tax=Frankia sp. B2 TaxID=2541730 RepID=UPI002104EACF|nr:transposase [Frankia sp. B2]
MGDERYRSSRCNGARWYLVLSCDDVPAAVVEPTGAVVGLDVGVASLVTTSNGDHYGNPRFLERSAERLADAQRDLSRKKRGSKRRKKAVARVAARSRAVARQRVDLANKAALELVRDHDLIAVEKLNIKSMVKRAAPKPDPDRPGAFLPNGQAAKTGLNTSILDAGWGVFFNVPRAKAESAGRTVVEVNARRTWVTRVASANQRSTSTACSRLVSFRCHRPPSATQPPTVRDAHAELSIVARKGSLR